MAEKEQDDMISEDDEQESSKTEEYVAVETKPESAEKQEAQSDDDDDEDDSRLSDEADDRDEIRKRRRAEKQERTQRRKAAIERDKIELNFLRQRNEQLEMRMQQLEHRSLSTEVQTIDQRLNEAVEEARAAERIMAKAIEAGAGSDVTKALKIRDEALARAQQLNALKAKVSQQQQQVAQPKADAPDPVVAELARNWISQNSWYNPKGSDVDSKIVQAIDQALTNEGYNPRSEEYWEELDRRVARRFPDKKVRDDDDGDTPPRTGRKGPAIGSSRDHAPSSTRKEVYISPERKQALVDAGVWDDPVLRQRYIKQYAKWDRDNNTAR